MGKNLVIVESPAKAKTIEKFLGKDFTVKSSFGHIRDLAKKNLGIDIANNFSPDYIVPDDKKKVVADLKAAVKKADTIWLASDEDREGEAIAWHLCETLELDPATSKRIVFHEITKDAILSAIDSPRSVNMDLVNAQQARRVLDRLVGFELSPILWRKIKPQLSAGRVQSVALRLIVDREREIMAFESTPYFKIEGVFHPDGTKPSVKVKTVLNHKFSTIEESENFLGKCRNAEFHISSIEKKDGTKSPSAPFTTSVLQQEAARKFGFSVNQTMSIAQRLYESGFITYMRTDSTNLSKLALATAKEAIISMYGAEYSKPRQYRTKSKGAQEAHEAIRPTYIQNTSIEGSAQEKKLYDLIWKRTIASQMADAKVEKTDIKITGSYNDPYIFEAQAEQIIFDGFLKVYMESKDDDGDGDNGENDNVALLPPLNIDQLMEPREISATEKFTQKPPRYNEASLVRKMEELGIGRPSTYAPTISTITSRGYITKGDRPATNRDIRELKLIDGNITSSVRSERTGAEKAKLFPESIGMVVTDFLAEHFPSILDYGFTAKVEEDFDKIAAGKMEWTKVLNLFYNPFHSLVEKTLEEKSQPRPERVIGSDPKSGKVLIARIGKFGPLVQKGENDDPQKQFASLKKGQLIESITLEEALKLFDLPREIGEYEGKSVTVAIGKFGPYIRYNSAFTSLGKNYDPYTISLEEAVTLIIESAEKEANKIIQTFPEYDIQVLNGRYGPYIKQGKKNFKIPKSSDPSKITLEEILEIIKK